MSVNSVTFAAGSFRPRQGARCFRTGTRAYPTRICKERATQPGPKRTAARRVAPNLGWCFDVVVIPLAEALAQVFRWKTPLLEPVAKVLVLHLCRKLCRSLSRGMPDPTKVATKAADKVFINLESVLA